MIFGIIILVLVIVLLALYTYKYNEESFKISFKESLDLVGVPIITFKNNNKKYNFILDTGASNSVINAKVLKQLEYTKIEGSSQLWGMEGNVQHVEYVKMPLYYWGVEFEEEFQVVNMEESFNKIKEGFGVTVSGILGSSFFNNYNYILDFKKLVAYTKNKNKKCKKKQ